MENDYTIIHDVHNKNNMDKVIDSDKRTILMRAALESHVSVVQNMLDAGADPNKTDNCGVTALMEAAEWGRADVVRALIKAGADMNLKDSQHNWQDRTALCIAAYKGHENVVHILVGAGATIGLALLYAVWGQKHNVVKYLIHTVGVDVDLYLDVVPSSQQTALILAAMLNDSEMTVLLLEAGADPNRTDGIGNTALHQAVLEGHTKLAHILMDAGTTIGIVNVGGNTPEQLARRHGHVTLANEMSARAHRKHA